jgi:hypothetical protein
VPARLTITRTSSGDVEQRQVIIKLDGEPFATLLYGQSATRTIEAGSHELRFDNTWAKKSIDFQIEEAEHVTFNVTNTAGRFTWWMVAALGAGPMYLKIERQPNAIPNS